MDKNKIRELCRTRNSGNKVGCMEIAIFYHPNPRHAQLPFLLLVALLLIRVVSAVCELQIVNISLNPPSSKPLRT